MAPRLQIALLGPVQILLDGRSLQFAYAQVRTLLIYLVVEAERVHQRDVLAALLWPDQSISMARTNLRQALSQLRAILGDRAAATPFVLAGRETIQFNRASSWSLDVAQFTALLAAVEQHNHHTLADCNACLAALEAAHDLYRGDLLQQTPLEGGFELEEWALLQRERLQRAALDALMRLANAYEQRSAADACRIARRMLALDRWREDAHRVVMRTLALLGERGAALAQYAQCRQILRAELGIEPSDETVALANALREGASANQAALPHPPARLMANPYKGLRAFGETDAGDFFGREALVEQVLAHLRAPPPAGRFLAVVGPSGSGKSSVVRAGLLPLLRRSGLPGVPHLRIATLTPGAQPLAELAAALARLDPATPHDIAALLARTPHGLVAAVQALVPERSELVLLIDQFEEVFTLTTDADMREQLLTLLCYAVAEPDSRVRVIITLRADFYDRPLLHPGLGALLRRHTALVLPLTVDELLHAIVRPAQQAGVTLADDLIAAIVHYVSARPGTLPLLQYALTELFERRETNLLTLETYRASGGVAGALNARAEAVYSGLDALGRQTAQQLFLRMIALDDGADDLRRRVTLAELGMAHADDPRQPVLRQLLAMYGRYRLLTFDRDPQSGAPTVELAHEALIRDWERLHAWCTQSREDLRVQRRLLAAAQEWIAAGRDVSFLAGGARLAQFAALAESTAIWLNADERAYLSASLQERERQAQLEHERRERELQAAREGVTRLRGLTNALMVFAALAQQQQQAAEEHAERAQGQALASAAQAAIAEGNLDQARTLAQAAVQVARPAPEAQAILSQAAYAPGTRRLLSGHHDAVMSAVFDGTGALALSGGSDLRVQLWDVTRGSVIRSFHGLEDNPWSVALSRDGRYALAGAADARIHIWDAQTGAELPRLSGHTADVTSIAVSPDGSLVLSASKDETIRLWDRASGQEIRRYSGHSGWVWSAVFSADGRTILSGSSDKTARLWDAHSGELIRCYIGHTNRVQRVAFSADGQLAVSCAWDETVRLWEVATGRELRVMSSYAGSVMSVALSPDGSLIASAAANRVQIWESATGREVHCFREHRDEVFSLAFTPDGRQVLSSSRDGTLRLWDLTNGAELRRITGHTSWVRDVAFSPDERLVLSSSWDWTARLWDTATGRELRQLVGHNNGVEGVAFSPDGRLALTSSVDQMVRLWEVASGALLRRFTSHTAYVWDVAFSPDGRLALSAGHDGTIRLWDLVTGAETRCLTGHIAGVECAVFSPDGRKILSGGIDATIREWDVASGKEIRQLHGHAGAVSSIAISADGRMALSGSTDGTVRLWDLVRGIDHGRFPKQAGPVLAVAFSPDGRTALFAAGLATLALWDVATGHELRRFDTGGALVYSAVFSADGRTILAGATDGVIRIWRVDTLPELLHFVQTERHLPALSPAQQERFEIGGEETLPGM